MNKMLRSLLAVIVTYSVVCGGVFAQQCETPNKELARCISVYQCPPFVQALKSQRTQQTVAFIRASGCGFQGNTPLVCCGSVAHYQTIATQPPVTVPTPPGPPTRHRNMNLLPARGKCGIQGIQDKVFGGKVAGLDEFPWMTLLEYRKNGRSQGHSCGGILLNEKYVLTAAHCIVGAITTAVGELFRVRLGEYDQRTSEDCDDDGCADPHQDIDVEKAIAHTGYNGRSLNRYHDIGLVRLKQRVRFNDFVKPVCLPLQEERTNPGENLTVAGWGYTEKKIFSPVKLKANVPVVSDNQCRQVYSTRYRVQLADTQLCAGGQEGIDSCNGDSGGPVMRTFPGKTDFYVEGIVSFGSEACGKVGVPGVYTRVTKYLNWILDNMEPF